MGEPSRTPQYAPRCLAVVMHDVERQCTRIGKYDGYCYQHIPTAGGYLPAAEAEAIVLDLMTPEREEVTDG